MIIYIILLSIFLFIDFCLHLMFSIKNVKINNKINFIGYKNNNRKLFSLNLIYCVLYSLLNAVIFSFLTFIFSGKELNIVIFILMIICSTTTTIFTAIKLANKIHLKSLVVTYGDKYTTNKITEFIRIPKKIENCARNNNNSESKYIEIFNTYLITKELLNNYFLDLHTNNISQNDDIYKKHLITENIIDEHYKELFDSIYLLTINDVVLNSMLIEDWSKLKDKLEKVTNHIEKELENNIENSLPENNYKSEKDILLEAILK